MSKTLDRQEIKKRIQSIQRQLSQLGSLRPGCLSLQYRKPKEKKGPYYQLSYTHQMRSRTEYIPSDLLAQIEQEIMEYHRYRELNQEWIELSIQRSRLEIQAWKKSKPRTRPAV